MEWYWILLLVFTGLVALMFTGLPIAISFLTLSCLAMYILLGEFGIRQLILGMYDRLCNFSFTPIPFFMIMGEVFYRSGLVSRVLDSLSKLVIKVPGRLSIITLLGGGIFAALSGSAIANTAMFGSLMLPEMSRRGYSKELTTGSIMASGALAMIIPPSTLAVLLGSIAKVSVGKILIGAILPGVLLLLLYIGYVIISCILKPSLAPDYEVEEVSTYEKLRAVLTDIIPLMGIFLMVVGAMFTGIATPTEAAAFGALGSYLIVAAYGKLSLKLVFDTLVGSLKVTGMILFIIAGSVGFSQLLALTGASREAVAAVVELSSSPYMILALMLTVVIILGFFMEATAIMMISLPLFMPIVYAFNIEPVWFCVLYLICLQIGQMTPPVGISLFTMKGVAPPEVTMSHIIRGAIPYVLLNILALLIIIAVPGIVTLLANR